MSGTLGLFCEGWTALDPDSNYLHGPGEDCLPGLALQGPQPALVLGCRMDGTGAAASGDLWMCLYLCLFKLGKAERSPLGLACPSEAQSCFLCSGPCLWLQV